MRIDKMCYTTLATCRAGTAMLYQCESGQKRCWERILGKEREIEGREGDRGKGGRQREGREEGRGGKEDRKGEKDGFGCWPYHCQTACYSQP